jgi:hypothetical protein
LGRVFETNDLCYVIANLLKNITVQAVVARVDKKSWNKTIANHFKSCRIYTFSINVIIKRQKINKLKLTIGFLKLYS